MNAFLAIVCDWAFCGLHFCHKLQTHQAFDAHDVYTSQCSYIDAQPMN